MPVVQPFFLSTSSAIVAAHNQDGTIKQQHQPGAAPVLWSLSMRRGWRVVMTLPLVTGQIADLTLSHVMDRVSASVAGVAPTSCMPVRRRV
jgi:hypothetical protein